MGCVSVSLLASAEQPEITESTSDVNIDFFVNPDNESEIR